MRLTNKYGVPKCMVAAAQNDPYNKGDCDYSITGLIASARQKALEKIFENELEEDITDVAFRLLGQSVHSVLERANATDLSEKRFFGTFAGKVVSAQIDTLSLDEDGTLTDFKVTTIYKFKKGTPPDADWVAQMNAQLELLRRNGYDAKKLQICGILRDFRPREAQFQLDYPDAQIAVIDVPIWPRERTVAYIEMRVAEHEAVKNLKAHELPECAPEERWAKDDEWKVIPKGKKKAMNGGVKKSLADAQALQAQVPGSRIEFDPGTYGKKCDGYCAAANFCDKYQKSLNKDEKQGRVK